jgi:hypothetical protein
MTAKPQEKQQDKQQEKQKSREHDTVVGNSVIHVLGQPRDLHRVQVRRLWEHYYRVNVFVGTDATTATVAHSFFLAADGEGKITSCSPTLTKQY